jgi:alpha-galactosidase
VTGKKSIFSFLLLTLLLSFAYPLPAYTHPHDGIALTPPMGWNTWNQLGCDINEKVIREMADALVSSGMRDAGYSYLNIDDCWQAASRDTQGKLQGDPVRFPNGMKALGDYIHSRGLKYGIYTSIGSVTCQGRPASIGNEALDARSFAEWGVDYLKDDFCGVPWLSLPFFDYKKHYLAMFNALKSTGRPIVFSICNWGVFSPWQWAPEISHLWRTTPDITPEWKRIINILDEQIGLEGYAGPGHWNDPDMLEVGVPPLTEIEAQTHFSLWAMLSAPLIAGNDLRKMSAGIRSVLTNPEVIAVDQEPLGIPALPVSTDFLAHTQIWLKPLTSVAGTTQKAVLLLNRGEKAVDITVRWKKLGFKTGVILVRDLWTHQDIVPVQDSYTAWDVPAHGAVMLRVTQQN